MAQEARPKAMAASALNRATLTNVVRPEFLERLGERRRVFIGSTVLDVRQDYTRDDARALTGPYDTGAKQAYRLNQAVAIPKKAKNPTMSVMLVTKGPDETAGSTPILLRVRGTKMPPSAAKNSTVTRARPITRPSSGDSNQSPARTPM